MVQKNVRRVIARWGAAMLTVAVATATVGVLGAGAAAADPVPPGAPVDPVPEAAATVDVLPTVQIDGVGWSQAIVGNRVFVGGEFTTARPAGSAPGVDTVGRKNFLAYDITTGVLDGFNPWVNAAVLTVAASPDGSRVYIGGQFTTANGSTRNRIAAYDVSTGKLVADFAPNLNGPVRSLFVTADRVFVGGSFTTANGATRNRLAAFDLAGNLTSWAPSANRQVEAMVVSPDGTKLVVGGRFNLLNGSTASGHGALSIATGALQSWPSNTTVVAGTSTTNGVGSLRSDGTTIYGAVFSQGGARTEGTFAVDGNTGVLTWLSDCHGDSYSAVPFHGQLFVASHAHSCDNVAGFPQTTPWTYWRGMAFTTEATQLNRRNTVDPASYTNWGGTPAPSVISWFPTMDMGTFTGMSQGPWHVTANDDYLVYAGEFPRVNSVGQQGLVRFARRDLAPKQTGPAAQANLKPLLRTTDAGTVQVSWQQTWDRDDRALTYKVYRNGNLVTPIHTATGTSRFWDQPWMSFEDTGRPAGSTIAYRVFAYDAAGNQTSGSTSTITVDGGGEPGDAYRAQVRADGASLLWRLREPSGSTVWDSSGGFVGTAGAGVVRGAAGGTATSFNGSSTSSVASRHQTWGPNIFSVQAWFSTTTSLGGQLVGFGKSATGTSTSSDRSLYLTNSGQAGFAVNSDGTMLSILSPSTYRDGSRHQVTGTFDGTTMRLFVDAVEVASRTVTVPVAGSQYGYWRVGGDTLAGVTSVPSRAFVTAAISDVAVYPTALGRDQVDAQWVAAGGTSTLPADLYGRAVLRQSPSLYWRLNESSGRPVADSSGQNNTGTHRSGTSAVPTGGALAGVTDQAATFDGSTSGVAGSSAVAAPTKFTVEAWVRTTSTAGGRVIGFGVNATSPSGTADRMLYLTPSGQAVFGVNYNSQLTVGSVAPVNDGQWHHLAGTFDGATMRLYVDGVEAGARSATAPGYTGYWRVGSGIVWNGATFLAADIDEAAVYASALSGQDLADRAFLGRHGVVNAAPVSAFTASATERTITLDATSSTDATGAIVSWAWDLGDGTQATGVVPPPHTYAANGTYPVTLTVTDEGGLSHTTAQQVTVARTNTLPVAQFGSTVTGLDLVVDATASHDTDGTVVSYDWDFGDGTTATGVAATHTYAAGGPRTVRLTVTDNDGGVAVSENQITAVGPNVDPTAAFTSAVQDLTVAFDGSTSVDPDGQIVDHVWDLGDGTAATGATVSHTYAAAGEYTVTLTVTDDRSGTHTVSTTVTVSPPPPADLALDRFEREVQNGLGAADLGGPWTTSGAAAGFGVTNGVGLLTLSGPGETDRVFLNGVNARDVDLVMDVATDRIANGGGVYLSAVARKVNTNDYRAKVRILSNGQVSLSLSRTIGNAETALTAVTVAGLVATPDVPLRIRLSVRDGGAPGSTDLQAKVWPAGTAEPLSWQVVATDATPALQTAGGVGFFGYVAASTTNVPIVLKLDNVTAGTPQ